MIESGIIYCVANVKIVIDLRYISNGSGYTALHRNNFLNVNNSTTLLNTVRGNENRPEHNQIIGKITPIDTDLVRCLPRTPTNTIYLSIAITVIERVDT